MSLEIDGSIQTYEKVSYGRLMLSEPDQTTGLRHHVWFDYTRDLFNRLTQGDILAAENFRKDAGNQWWSLLEVQEVIPTHFALGQKAGELSSSYPEFSMDVAKEGFLDWKTQDTSSNDQTTKIRVIATPLNLQMHRDATKHNVVPETHMPMPGTEVRIVTLALAQKIINANLDPAASNITSVGQNMAGIRQNAEADVLVDVEGFLKKHFGIFGFTGVGKSNLLNQLITLFLDARFSAPGSTATEAPKLIVFDLMDEYKTLLIDQLLRNDVDGYYLAIGEKSIPMATYEYMRKVPTDRDAAKLARAVDELHQQFLFPRSLQADSDNFREGVEKLVTSNRLRLLDEGEVPVSVYLEDIEDSLLHESFGPGQVSIVRQIKQDIFEPRRSKEMNKAVTSEIIDELQKMQKDVTLPWKGAIIDRTEGLVRILKQHLAALQAPPDAPGLTMQLKQVLRIINNPSKPALIIVTSHDAEELRRFAQKMCLWAFDERRKSGKNGPQASFIFDEADEFMPNSPTGNQVFTKEAIQRLARRGRKFGLGVGLATQRIAYLDTNSLGQIHTYFISRLPRDYDRDTIAKAFGLSEEVFKPTFRFAPGDWMLLSHEATGLRGKPIYLHVDDSEKRLREFAKRTSVKATAPQATEPLAK